jgi:hypothetical protein
MAKELGQKASRLAKLVKEPQGRAKNPKRAATAPKSFPERLRARRFPRLTQLEDRRREILKSLALPPGVSLNVDPKLEDALARLTVEFGSTEELAKRLKALGLLPGQPLFQELWLLKWPE